MTICVECNNCQSKFKTDANHAGKSTRCPHCRQPIQVPLENHPTRERISSAVNNGQADSLNGMPAVENLLCESEIPSQNGIPTRDSLTQQLLDGFTGPIKKPRPTIRYQISTVIVALVMLLLPAIYLALIALVGYGVYYHTVNHAGMLEIYLTPLGSFLLHIAYSVPIICGLILILFMLKPFLAKQTTHTRIRSLKRDKEPLLFEFIDRICHSIGSSTPTRIDLDCELNASASYGLGFRSMLGNQLILTIGLPLVAGLNTRQFAGILAHEFGHFAQGTGMRLTYLIRSVSLWLQRVVYQRDIADRWLSQATESLDIHIAWIPYLASIFVWLTRRVLWLLMMIGHFFCSYLLRQMEFDADRYEARLVGSDTFMQTAVGLQILGVASQRVMNDLEQKYSRRSTR